MTRHGLAKVTAMVGLLTLGTVGCGGGAGEVRSDDPDGTVRPGNTVSYGSFGTSGSIDCGDSRNVEISGSNNTLTLTGICASVRVTGADNKITADRVDSEIVVSGLNNTVSYRAGKPALTNTGSGNVVRADQPAQRP